MTSESWRESGGAGGGVEWGLCVISSSLMSTQHGEANQSVSIPVMENWY